MIVLLDTHIILWAADSPERLGGAADVLDQADGLLLSAASVWELAIKQGLGKVDLGMDVHLWTERAAHELSAAMLDVTSRHAAAVEHLPQIHRDPFDRVLVAQARLEGAMLLTADRALSDYGESVRLVHQT